MNARRCFLFCIIFATHASLGMHFPYKEWHIQRCECSDVINEVCGSNHVTYPNLCELDCESIFVPDLTIKNLGPCMSEYDICVCPKVWNPVCGSDGYTYGNICELKCSSKTYGGEVHVDFIGVCEPRVDDASLEESISEEDVDNTGAEQVGLPCSAYSSPDRLCNATLCESEVNTSLCGNDGVTYKNYCSFCCAYFKNPDFKIVRKGDCDVVVTKEATSEKPEATKS